MSETQGVRLSALRQVADQFKQHVPAADGDGDGRLKMKEARAYGHSLRDGFKVGRALTTMTSWALRDLQRGKSAAISHIQGKADEALEIFERKDLNGNGILDKGRELNSVKRLKSFQVLRALVEAPQSGSKLTAKKLGEAIAPFIPKALYISESDYNPEYFDVRFSKNKPMKGDQIVKALNNTLAGFYDEQSGDMSGYTFEMFSAKKARDFLTGLADAENSDPESAQAFAEIVKRLRANLTDIKVLNFGPKDEDGSLAVDQGLYVKVVAGRSKDGKLAGIMLGSVET